MPASAAAAVRLIILFISLPVFVTAKLYNRDGTAYIRRAVNFRFFCFEMLFFTILKNRTAFLGISRFDRVRYLLKPSDAVVKKSLRRSQKFSQNP